MLRRQRSRRLPRIAFGVPAFVRAARSLVPLLAAAICACSPPSESPESRPHAEFAPDPDDLWIAVAGRGPFASQDDDGTLVPIARYLDGTWDNAPWADIFSIDGPGTGVEAVKTGDGVWSWPDASRYWGHPGRTVDTLGRAPEVIATGVPRSWLLFSRNVQGQPLSTTGLAVTSAHCLYRWAISIPRDTVPAGEATDVYGPPAIALTRAPAEVLSEDDIPGLEQIRGALGFADISEGRKGDRGFYWLGIFRFDGTMGNAGSAPGPTDGELESTTLGVLWGRYYEGAEYIVIEIDGDRSRVIIRTYEGGC